MDVAIFREETDSITYYQSALFEANLTMENFLERERLSYPKDKLDIDNNEFANWNDIKQSLEEDVVMISYSYSETKGYITVMSKSSKEIITIDISMLEANIQTLNELVQNSFAFQRPIRERFIEVSHQLYETLIKPIWTSSA